MIQGMHFGDELAMLFRPTAPQHGWTCTLTGLGSLLIEAFMKVHMNLTSFLSFEVRLCSPASLRAPPHTCCATSGPCAPGVRPPVRRVRAGPVVVTFSLNLTLRECTDPVQILRREQREEEVGVNLPSLGRGWPSLLVLEMPLCLLPCWGFLAYLGSRLFSFVASVELSRVPSARLLARTQGHHAPVRLVSARPRRVCVGPLAAMA